MHGLTLRRVWFGVALLVWVLLGMVIGAGALLLAFQNLLIQR